MSKDLSGPHKFPMLEGICEQLPRKEFPTDRGIGEHLNAKLAHHQRQELKLEATVQELAIEIAALQSDLAAARAELARAREALIKQWSEGYNYLRPGAAKRYAYEIEQAHTGEEG